MARALHIDHVATKTGGFQEGASVAVYQVGTSTLATLYAAETGAKTLSNPLLTDANGKVRFWAETGDYDVQVIIGDDAATQTITVGPGEAAVIDGAGITGDGTSSAPLSLDIDGMTDGTADFLANGADVPASVGGELLRVSLQPLLAGAGLSGGGRVGNPLTLDIDGLEDISADYASQGGTAAVLVGDTLGKANIGTIAGAGISGTGLASNPLTLDVAGLSDLSSQVASYGVWLPGLTGAGLDTLGKFFLTKPMMTMLTRNASDINSPSAGEAITFEETLGDHTVNLATGEITIPANRKTLLLGKLRAKFSNSTGVLVHEWGVVSGDSSNFVWSYGRVESESAYDGAKDATAMLDPSEDTVVRWVINGLLNVDTVNRRYLSAIILTL